MADPAGWFDSTAVPVGWFDDTAAPGGWFDSTALEAQAQGQQPIVGSLTATLGTLGGVGGGQLALAGQLPPGQLGALTLAASGAVQLSASAAISLGAIEINAAASLAIAGQVGGALSTLAASGSAQVAVAGQMQAGQLDQLTLVAVGAGSAINGSLAVTIADLTIYATGMLQARTTEAVAGGKRRISWSDIDDEDQIEDAEAELMLTVASTLITSGVLWAA